MGFQFKHMIFLSGSAVKSRSCRGFFRETGVDFLVIPGEEVHSPDNFLLRNYYPKHKELRSQLGTQMSRMASSGLNEDAGMIEKLQSPRPSETFEPMRWKAQN